MTDASSSRPSKPRRRWFHFSLRTLLIGVTLVAGLLVAWRVYVEPYRRQRETMKLVEELGGSYKTEAGGPEWMRDWLGVDNFQNIVLVDVADCDEPEKYLEQVASLPGLETLVVGGRTFTDEHLSTLKRLTKLSGLVLDSTNVTDDGIRALKRTLPELAIHKSQRRAIAAMEKLTRILKTEMSGEYAELKKRVGDEHFRDATIFDCMFKSVSDSDLAHLKGLMTLQSVRLRGTQVTDVGLEHLKGLTNLLGLGLGHTKVTDVGLVHLKGLVNLQSLDFRGTRVTDVGLSHLEGLTNLRQLILTDTTVTDAGLEHLKGLVNLLGIVLDQTKVTGAGLAHLKGLKGLSLGKTQLADVGLEHLKELTNLRALGLGQTKVTDAGLIHLKGLTNLQYLDLHGTQVTESGVKNLQKALLNCTIIH